MRYLTLSALTGMVLFAPTAWAQTVQCDDHVGAVTRSGSAYVLDWQDTMCLEHHDRLIRMERIAEKFSDDVRPTFSEFVVPKDRLPAIFARDVPLLRVVFPEKSFFNTGESRIKPDAYAALQIIAASLRKEIPDVAVFVVGHTDSRGGETYNYNLSVDRATAVSSALRDIGVGQVSLWRVGFGEAVPLVPNDTPDHMAINRRVEFIFGAKTEAVVNWLEEQQPSLCAAADTNSEISCKRVIARPRFIAVALTPRYGLVTKPQISGRDADAPRPSGDTADVRRHAHVINMPRPGELVLTLRPHSRAIDAPRPF